MNTLLAILCVFSFSLTVPVTRIATQVLDPATAAALRLAGAAAVCALVVALFDRWVPPRRLLPRLIGVSLGSVIGFSFFVSKAMKSVPSSHGVIALAALPVLTAAYSSLRDRSSPGRAFWAFSALGTLLSLSFFFVDRSVALGAGDLYLVGALIASAFGYVEGARLSREHGGRRVMSWAILIAAPFAGFLLLSGTGLADLHKLAAHPAAAGAVLYLALVSQSFGMFLWYHVLANGQMAKVAMTQLLQPFFSLAAGAALLDESASATTWLIASLVMACVVGANRQRKAAAVLPRTSLVTGTGAAATESRSKSTTSTASRSCG